MTHTRALLAPRSALSLAALACTTSISSCPPPLLQSDPELQKEYKHHHKNVWPEMRDALQRSGWHNYSLFMKKDGTLFGYFESDKPLDECIKGALA